MHITLVKQPEYALNVTTRELKALRSIVGRTVYSTLAEQHEQRYSEKYPISAAEHHALFDALDEAVKNA